MKNQKVIIAVVICVVVAGLSFWGGMKYGQSKNVASFANRQSQTPGNFSQRTGGQQGIRGGAAGGFTSGQVISKDDKSITVQLNGNGSKIVFYSPSTTVEKNVSGAINDVAVGSQVMVTGATNPDGSISATSIQLRPAMAKNIPTKQ